MLLWMYAHANVRALDGCSTRRCLDYELRQVGWRGCDRQQV
ncbi:MAG: hypothetical protein ACOC4M_16775 [Promethearchaeia archaeon]